MERSYTHRTRLEKLAIKAGSRVAVVGFADDELASEIEAGLGLRPSRHVRAGKYDAIVKLIEGQAGLAQLAGLREKLAPAGVLWLVYRKGKHAPVPEHAVLAAILAANLVDNKVMSFSETHTATRAVIRLKDRER